MQQHLPTATRSSLPSDTWGDYQAPPIAAPIVNGVPKLLFDDDEVGVMFGISVSTVRNRYCVTSKWYDPAFPVPRHTGGGTGRKSAVRWHWADLCHYAQNLPHVPFGHAGGKLQSARPSRALAYGSRLTASGSEDPSTAFKI